jgi:hypothetical protein
MRQHSGLRKYGLSAQLICIIPPGVQVSVGIAKVGVVGSNPIVPTRENKDLEAPKGAFLLPKTPSGENPGESDA